MSLFDLIAGERFGELGVEDFYFVWGVDGIEDVISVDEIIKVNDNSYYISDNRLGIILWRNYVSGGFAIIETKNKIFLGNYGE